MAGLEVLNPVARSVQQRLKPAPRVHDLSGKRVGLYWNMKAGGDVALARVEELLRERYPAAQFSHFQGSVGWLMRHVTPADADRIARQCDVLVGTTSD